MALKNNSRLHRNTISSLSYQLVAIICGFVLPRLILKQYGSNVNGLVNSISQFLSIISFLELGVGSVVKSALYKPCAEHNTVRISEIYKSAQKFFNKIALILLIYVIALLGVFPLLINKEYGWFFIDTLIIAMSVTSFAEYYFGTVNSLLLQADQRNSILFDIRTITLVLNTFACFLLIKLGCSIQVVKLVTSVLFLCRPVFLTWYVNKTYKIDRKIQYSGEPIKQKWNGIAQHIASVVMSQTDTIVLTVFSSLETVSIYSVYYMPIVAIEQLIIYAVNGYESHIGALWAKENKKIVSESFNKFVWVLHTVTVLLYGCAASSIGSFISVYTKGITDADYSQPIFGYILIAAYTLYCFRLSSTIVIKAAGHYRQTQTSFIIATVINLFISITVVKKYGLIGVAVGTLCSMLYHSIRLEIYTAKNLVDRPFKTIAKQVMTDVTIIFIAMPVTMLLPKVASNYLTWAIQAFVCFSIWLVVCTVVNIFLNKDFITSFIVGKLRRKRG